RKIQKCKSLSGDNRQGTFEQWIERKQIEEKWINFVKKHHEELIKLLDIVEDGLPSKTKEKKLDPY
ncbi:13932_t:CDS:2, partial [Entrophospora sp. SA101]